ncbi:MAG: signal peptidase I [Nitrospirae bacterium]|nr:signal peptidase I [Nitrospirota bacterium]
MADKKRKRSIIREYLEAIATAFVLAIIVITFVVQAFKIPSGSMIPTLSVGDHIFVLKFMYSIKNPFSDTILFHTWEPKRGDVVVFKYPKNEKIDFIKRLIGEPGDTIEIRSKQVYINGEPLKEPYSIHSDPLTIRERDEFGPVTVPAGKYFMMGDNRDQSLDSRFWGFVSENKIKGKAFLIYWSWDGKDRWVRWERTGNLIH